MLGWAITFLIIALVAAVLGFGGIAGFAVEAAKLVFFVAAVFVYVLPCAALLLTERFGGGLLAATVAVPSCLLGKMLEQHVYETALAGELLAAG